MKLSELEHKKILLVGYGIEGKATEAFLKKMVPTATFAIADIAQGENYLDHQKDYDLAIKSPHVKPELLLIPYTTATNIFFANVKGITIGVSGTKGKTTTASLMYAILKQAGRKVHLVGNIGNPMLSELLVSNTQEDIWVCELSSYQLMDTEYSPDISVLVSLFPEHMDFHGSVEKYYAAKAQIVAHATQEDYFVYNPRFKELQKIANTTNAKAVPYSTDIPFDTSKVHLLGEHNQDNIKAAVTVGNILQVPTSIMEEAIKNFQPVRHRLQKVGTFNDITFYDDAISTTPQSALAALSALPNVGTIFLGGQDRGYDFTHLVEELIAKNIPNIVFFPDSGEKILQLLKEKTTHLPRILQTTSMKEAIDFAYQYSPKGSVCLLSTASPSYTVWKNFEEKGDEFQRLVKEEADKFSN